MFRRSASRLWFGAAIVVLGITGSTAGRAEAQATAVTLEVPDAPAAGYAIRGEGFPAGSWIWIDVDDVTDGSQPAHGPDAFEPAWDGSFVRSSGSALPCGHSFRATAFVDDQVVATSPLATPGCEPPPPSLVLAFPDGPAEGFTVQGSGFAPGAWIWVTIGDATDGTQPVDGPDAFLPDGAGAFTRVGATALTCGHVYTARAWVLDAVAAASEPVTPSCPGAGGNAATADPNANAATQAAYAYLRDSPNRPDRRLAIGQALRGWDFGAPVAEPVNALTAAGLPAPKLLELDLTDFGVTPEHDQELYGILLDHSARGGLVGLSYHVDNPFTGGSCYDRGGVDLAELADPAGAQTAAGRRWRASLDRASSVMERLQAAGAVVLFRPLHESNGDWFWWGQRDPAGFAAAWRGMLSYLTETKGIHDLLWVYSANRNLGGALSDPTRLFPGNDVVDVVGVDVYDDDLSIAGGGEPGYAELVALGEPFAITEYGAGNWPNEHDGAVELPNAEVIQRIRQQYPATVLATAWYSQAGNNWQMSDKPDPAALLLDPWAVTR